MKQMIKLILILSFSLLVNQALANPISFQSHAEIEAAVKQFVKSKVRGSANTDIEIRVNALDPRLKLVKCDTPLSVNLPHNTRINSRFSVGIRCNGAKPWQLYVPVNVAKYTNIYVANSALAKGDVISESDIRLVRTDIQKLRSRPIKDAKKLIGMVANRSIAVGSPFNARHMRFPTVVKKGDPVDIIASTRGLNIRMTGKAMSAGAKGQRIKVKNNSSRKTINAIVVNSSTVKVSL